MEGDGFEGVIGKDNPYYPLIQPHLPSLPTIFEGRPQDHHWQGQAKIPLRMACRPQDDRTVFLYSFDFPTDPQRCIQLMKDFDFQKKVDPNIDEFRLESQPGLPHTQHIYLAYKKIFIVMPRDFVYIRHTFQHKGALWMVSVSDPTAAVNKSKTRGEIILTAARAVPAEGGCRVDFYSQVDMKMKIKFETAKGRGFLQLRKYLQRFREAATQ